MIRFVDQSGQLGGAELCLADLAHHWRQEARVLLLAKGPLADRLRGSGIETDCLPLPEALSRITRHAGLATALRAIPAACRYRRQLRNALAGASLLYFNTPKALLAGAAATLGHRCPTVFHLHDLLIPAHFSTMNRRLLVAAANRVDLVIANSKATAAAYRAAGGRHHPVVIPNGIDPAPFDAVRPEQVAALHAEWNPEGRPVLAIFGRLARWKGQAVLLRALRHLPDAIVWIVGEALFTGDDHAYATTLREEADPARVRFLGFRDDIPALMKAADVVVHCSLAPEPFGRVLVEGMLAGRPVVAMQGGGADEILDGLGTLLPPGDEAALATTLQHLLADAPLRTQLGHQGRERALSHYTLATVLAQTEATLQLLLSPR